MSKNELSAVNRSAMNQKMPSRCPQCGRGCPADQLSCDRGRAYFMALQRGEALPESSGERHHREHKENHEGHSHRGHGHHRHLSAEDFEDCDDPGELLRSCGHFLYHRNHHHFGKTQDQVLSSLNENGGSLDQHAIQEQLRIQPGSASELLSKLAAKGLIIRQRDEEDHRHVIISLTKAGQDYARQLDPQRDKELFEELNAGEIDTLIQILKKLLKSWYTV